VVSPERGENADLALAHLRETASRDADLVASGSTAATAQEFLDWFTRYLVSATAADLAYVGTFGGASTETVAMTSLSTDDASTSAHEFTLAGSPGSCALTADLVTVADGALDVFPEDSFLRDHAIAGCAAIAICNPSGQPLGVAVALSRSPLDESALALISGTLDAFRSRIASAMTSSQKTAELSDVLEASQEGSDDETMKSLMRLLARAMNVKAAFVSELTDAENGLASSLALVVDGTARPNMNFAIAGTPTAQVLQDGAAFYAASVSEKYPEVAFLRELRADGYVAVTLHGPNGAPIGFLGLIHDGPLDVDPRDSALFQAHVSRVTSELLRIRAERRCLTLERELLAAQRAESLGLLAGGVAHDFRNILATIVGNVDLAAAELSLDSPLHVRMGEIKTAASLASRLCSQLMSYAGRGRLTRQVVDVNQLIHDMEDLLGVSMTQKCQLDLGLASELPAVEGDVAQLQQVVLNLLTNASEATGRAGGTVSVRTSLVAASESPSHGAVLPPELHEGDHVLIEVMDEGCGMTPEVLERAFEPFFSTKSALGCRGLGLAALAGIVRTHGGTVTAQTESGVGTTVRIYLPASPLTAPPRGWPQHPRAHSAVTTKVLVADDEPTVREIAETMLVAAGFDVLLAADGQQTLAAVERHGDEIGCIILDLVMPHTDGAEVIRTLKRANSPIPIVISSGFPVDFLQEQFSPGDIAATLRKPYTADDLVEIVDSVLVGADA